MRKNFEIFVSWFMPSNKIQESYHKTIEDVEICSPKEFCFLLVLTGSMCNMYLNMYKCTLIYLKLLCVL